MHGIPGMSHVPSYTLLKPLLTPSRASPLQSSPQEGLGPSAQPSRSVLWGQDVPRPSPREAPSRDLVSAPLLARPFSSVHCSLPNGGGSSWGTGCRGWGSSVHTIPRSGAAPGRVCAAHAHTCVLSWPGSSPLRSFCATPPACLTAVCSDRGSRGLGWHFLPERARFPSG